MTESRDRGYRIYFTVMLVILFFFPVGRALWLNITSAESIALLTSASAPSVAVLLIGVLWSGALLLGRFLGPALLSPFATYTFAGGPRPYSSVFLRTFLRTSAAVTVSVMGLSLLIAGALLSVNHISIEVFTVFGLSGALVGIIASACWLIGQVYPWFAMSFTAVIAVFAVGMAFFVPLYEIFSALALASSALLPTVSASLALTALVLMILVPRMLNALEYQRLIDQALRRESALMFVGTMDFAGATSVYQPKVSRGRFLRAVRMGGRVQGRFFIKDAVGAIRSPGRFTFGIVTLMVAGLFLILGTVFGSFGWFFGVAAGLLAFAGMGAFTEGLRHAAEVSGGSPLYGMSDLALVMNHSLFPLLLSLLVLLVVVTIFGLSVGSGGIFASLVGAVTVGAGSFLARVSSAAKGLMPVIFFTPMQTPIGDMSAVIRIVWSLDGLLISGFAGLAAVSVLTNPLLAVGVMGTALGVIWGRWRNRR